MKRVALAVIFCLVVGSSAFAQGTFPAMDVVSKVADSVVSIDVNRVVYGSALGGNLYTHTRLATTYQTGFVYTENGYIITDSRNIEDANILTVWLNDGTELEAEFVGIDEDYGIGVLKVETEEPLQPVQIIEGRYDPLKDYYPYDQGDAVVAVGYSGGLGGTVTSGVISSIRNFRNRNEILLPNVIQSDVAINAGNEGCPLFNEDGKVIGMHDLREADMQNTTFFTPAWLITRVADELIEIYETGTEDEVWHPWLGVKPFAGSISLARGTYREVGDDLKMYMDIPDQYWDVGVLIDSVWLESPAREFGMLDHDMILDVTVLHVDVETGEETVKIPYRLLKSVEELEIMVTTAEKGDIFLFGVLRNYNYFNIEVEIGQHPGSFTYLSATSGQSLYPDPDGYIPDLERSNDYF
ncbi:trypsin-like peptidase domain-containing protein [bacterium]|nr:trypsin-like peptidase domain-containing protein [bacterium]